LQLIELSGFWNLVILVVREERLSLFDPIDNGVVTHACSSLNGTKAHAVEIEDETMFLDGGWIAFGLVSIQELTRTLTAQVVLLLLTATVLDDVGGLTVWTLHQETPNAASYYYCATPISGWVCLLKPG
jgi:hypothetical protein